MSRPRVVIAEPIDAQASAWLRERAEVIEAFEKSELAGALRDADGLIVRTYTRVDAALLDGAPNLRAVGRAGVGIDNIDAEACTARGIRVVNTPDANTGAVVEYVLSAVFSSVRPLERVTGAVDAEEWARLRAAAIAERELSECTVGIWGMGRIGQAVAQATAPLAKKLVYHDLLDIPQSHRYGAEPVSAEALAEQSDVITLHVDGRESNRGLIAATELAQMKQDAVLINASRGFVVDTPALASFLAKNPNARAVLDVHESEPITAENPLLHMQNAHLTAHIGAATSRAKRAMSWVVKPVWEALDR